MCQDQEADAEGQESGRPKNYTCIETEENKTKKGVTNSHDTTYC